MKEKQSNSKSHPPAMFGDFTTVGSATTPRESKILVKEPPMKLAEATTPASGATCQRTSSMARSERFRSPPFFEGMMC